MPYTSDSRDAGFSLIEILVALTVFSLIAAASTTVLMSTLQAKETATALSTEQRKLQVARSLMKQDFAQMVARPARGPYGDAVPQSLRGGGAIRDDNSVLIEFSRRGWVNPGGRIGRGNVQHVRYLFENGAIIRETRRRTDPTPDTPIDRRTLLTDITRADIQFFDGRVWQPDVVSGGFETSYFPRAVMLRMTDSTGHSVDHLFTVKGSMP